ncbi:hypothetical protein MMC22_009805 [Lobaria immixta]|nr:hypothetical protein [Lobaria immixta]
MPFCNLVTKTHRATQQDAFQPTAAATLAASPVKRQDRIRCWGPLPRRIPPDYPMFPNVLAMCALTTTGDLMNLGCICAGANLLICGSSRRPVVRVMLDWCYSHCSCGPNTETRPNQSTEDLDGAVGQTSAGDPAGKVHGSGQQHAPKPHTAPSGNNPTGSTYACSGTCTSVDRGCDWAFDGDCKCFAPPVSLLFWHKGDCGTRLPFKVKRDLVQQRHSYYRNATAQFASSDKITAPAGTLPDHAAQLASGLLPSPCNASYVSFACSDSPDGIVHEPLQNWLGALVPEGAKELPPVPKEFLRIHGGKEGKMQVLRPAVD